LNTPYPKQETYQPNPDKKRTLGALSCVYQSICITHLSPSYQHKMGYDASPGSNYLEPSQTSASVFDV